MVNISMNESNTKTRYYICYWDCDGFECIVDFTSWERNKLVSLLKNGDYADKPPVNLHHLILRAQFNPHRFPEIWSFTTTDDVSVEDLRIIAEETPQVLVDMIRERGKNLYGKPNRAGARIK